MTLLFYVDESREGAVHVHAGVLVGGDVAAAVDAELDRIVRMAAAADICSSDTAELHGSELFSGAGEWSSGNIQQRVQVFDDVLGSLGRLGAEIISRAIIIPDYRGRYGGDPYPKAFSNLLERVQSRLDQHKQFGLVIADQQHQYAEQLRDDLQFAHRWGTGGYNSSNLTRVLDTVHFVDSKRSRLTQAADMVAFMIRRRAVRPMEKDERLEAAMSRWDSLINAAVPEHKGRYRSTWTKP